MVFLFYVKKVFYGELQEGNRSQGGQNKRYKDTLASLKDFNFPTESWEQAHSVVASPTKELHSLKKRESVKQKESAKNGKQEPRDHHRTQHRQS